MWTQWTLGVYYVRPAVVSYMSASKSGLMLGFHHDKGKPKIYFDVVYLQMKQVIDSNTNSREKPNLLHFRLGMEKWWTFLNVRS